jgi:hypothetical protein
VADVYNQGCELLSIAALPPDVRKASGLPASFKIVSGLRPVWWGVAPSV